MADIRQFKAFVAVAEELNFHRAAEKLGTVQPALSRLVRNLEDEIKVQLFQRTTRHVELTEAGKTFLIEARGALEHMGSAVRTAQQTAQGTAGTLNLAYMDFAVHRLLPDMLAAVARQSSSIHVELMYMSTARQRLALLEGKIDLGILIGQMSSPHVEQILLCNEPVTVALPEKHPLAARRKIKLEEIISEPVLIGNESDWTAFRDIIFQLYAREGATPQLHLEASSAPALLGMAAKGLGIVFYAGFPSLYQGSGLVFRPLAPPCNVPISLVWRKGPKLPLIRQMLKLCGLDK